MDGATEKLGKDILGFLAEGPVHFEEILLHFRKVAYKDLLRAWGWLRENDLLGRELETGKYRISNNK